MNYYIHIRILLLVASLSITFVRSYTQSKAGLYQYEFELLELPNDIKGNYVNTIAQDTAGFMWFGTQAGLIKWDGYQFVSYVHDDLQNSVANDEVKSIVVDEDGNLWLGLNKRKIDYFNVHTETFTHYSWVNDSTQLPYENYVRELVLDKKGNLWIASNNGLHQFNTATKSFQSFYHDEENTNSLSYDNCTSIQIDNNGTLWIGTGNEIPNGFDGFNGKSVGGLNKYRPETNDFTRYRHDPDNINSLADDFITDLYADEKGNLWIGMIQGKIQQFDSRSNAFINFSGDPTSLNILDNFSTVNVAEQHINFIFEDKDQFLWIGLWQNGIRNFDLKNGKSVDYLSLNNDEHSYLEPFPSLMFQSKDGTLWMATNNNSARLYKVVKKRIKTFKFHEDEALLASFITESNEGNILIATEKPSILVAFNPENNEIDILNENNEWPFIDQENLIAIDYKDTDLYSWWKIVKDKSGKIWSNIYLRNELFLLDLESEEILVYPPADNNNTLVYNNWVTEVYEDRNDNMWFTTKSGLLRKYNDQTDNFSNWFFGENENDPYRNYYSILAHGENDDLWIAYTSESQINIKKFDIQKEIFKELRLIYDSPDPDFQFTLTHRILYIDNFIWICLDTKLLKVDPKTGKTITYNPSHFGLSRFNNMQSDQNGRLWLFGNKVVLFNIEDESFAQYDIPQDFKIKSTLGLNHETRVFESSTGEIYFSTVEGMAHFNPLEFTGTGPINPKTYFSKFEVLFQEDEKKNKFKPIHNLESNGVKLLHHQNNFKINFSALNYDYQSDARFQYKLEGYDDRWRNAEQAPEATYIKIPPGKYTFLVKNTMNGNTWGPENQLYIDISPAFWASIWAYMFYIFVFGLTVFGIYRFLIKQKLNEAEANRLKELDSVKTRLYTNITHEFRTPLTVISGMASQIKENPDDWLVDGIPMIERNTERLLSLVNQMLDLSKLESGKAKLNLHQGDIINYLKYVVESFHSLADAKNIRVHFYAEEEEILMDFDEEKIQQIINNLVSNAIKYSPKNGDVYVTLNLLESPLNGLNENESKVLQIEVRNNGVGIAEKDLPYVFDRFYQVDDSDTRSNEGSGIGLSLVKELVQLMKGTIMVRSRKEKDTTFTILLPIKRDTPLFESDYKSDKKISTQKIVNNKTTESFNTDNNLNTKKQTVLLIEDNPDVVAYVAICLQDLYNIKVGTNGQEGIDIALELIPDLIITDVMMPVKNGFEVCQILKNNPLTSHIPVVMLTAKADQKSKLQGLETGVDAFLVKPFNKKELLVRLRKLLELRVILQERYRSIMGSKIPALSIPEEKKPQQKVDDDFIQHVRDVVLENLENVDFGVDDLCKKVGMSRSQFYRKLVAMVDMAPNNFIKYIRLSKAKQLLKNLDKNISTVAFEIGFNDSSYFSRAFKKEFGMTPMEYRNSFN